MIIVHRNRTAAIVVLQVKDAKVYGVYFVIELLCKGSSTYNGSRGEGRGFANTVRLFK